MADSDVAQLVISQLEGLRSDLREDRRAAGDEVRLLHARISERDEKSRERDAELTGLIQAMEARLQSAASVDQLAELERACIGRSRSTESGTDAHRRKTTWWTRALTANPLASFLGLLLVVIIVVLVIAVFRVPASQLNPWSAS